MSLTLFKEWVVTNYAYSSMQHSKLFSLAIFGLSVNYVVEGYAHRSLPADNYYKPLSCSCCLK
jgi:hypothetical protein